MIRAGIEGDAFYGEEVSAKEGNYQLAIAQKLAL